MVRGGSGEDQVNVSLSVEFQVNVKSQSELDIGGRETCVLLSPTCHATSLCLPFLGED